MTRTEIWLTEMMCHFKSIDDMRRYYEHLVSLPNCNTCKRKDCEHKPKYGEDVRFNCFAYTDEEPKDEPQTDCAWSAPDAPRTVPLYPMKEGGETDEDNSR